MSIRRSLLAIAATALATMAFASSAMAVTEDKVVHVTTGATIPAGEELQFTGWASFTVPGLASYKCDVTSTVAATGTTGTTGHVKVFTTNTSCTGTGFATGCQIETHESTPTNGAGEHVWDVTATENDFDVFNNDPNHDGGKIVLHIKYKNEGLFCALRGTETTLTFDSITLKPFKTGSRVVTDTFNKLGETAATGDPIAGVELSGVGTLDTEPGDTDEVVVAGELELVEGDRCTWKFAKD
jgi:hypothetical protein